MKEREEREREREKKMYTQVKYDFILERVKGKETRECGYKRVDLCGRECVCEGYREREKGGER